MLMEAFLLRFNLVDGILCLNVNTAYRALENADLRTVAACLDNAGLFLDADDLTDDTAYSGDLVANVEVVAHISDLLILLFLLAGGDDHENDHNADDKDHGEQGKNICTRLARCAGCEKQCNSVHFLGPFCEKLKYPIYCTCTKVKIQLSNCKFFVYCRLFFENTEKKKKICQSVDFFIGLCYNLFCIIM